MGNDTAAFIVLFLILAFITIIACAQLRSSSTKPSSPTKSSSHAKPLINKTELFFLAVISTVIKNSNPSLKVLPQIPLSQIVNITDLNLSSKQIGKAMTLVCDMVIFSANWYPLLVIEVNGKGHYQNNWKERDALKALILKQASIPLKIIHPHHFSHGRKATQKLIAKKLIPSLPVNPAAQNR